MDWEIEIDTESPVITMSLGTPLDSVEFEMNEEEFEFFLQSIEQFIKEREDDYIKRKESKKSFRRVLNRS